MSEKHRVRRRRRKAVAEAIDTATFGKEFFSRHLRGFIRDRCPELAEAVPVLELDLHDGQRLDVCHVMGLAPAWVALAAHDEAASSGARVMQTVLVPYGSIVRVTIRAVRRESGRVGFVQDQAPAFVDTAAPASAESLLRGASSPPGRVGAARATARRGRRTS
jgi:hypothetical protein